MKFTCGTASVHLMGVFISKRMYKAAPAVRDSLLQLSKLMQLMQKGKQIHGQRRIPANNNGRFNRPSFCYSTVLRDSTMSMRKSLGSMTMLTSIVKSSVSA